jgi:hypothetical protein
MGRGGTRPHQLGYGFQIHDRLVHLAASGYTQAVMATRLEVAEMPLDR